MYNEAYDNDLWWPTDFEADENIPGIHTWNTGDSDAANFSDTYASEVRDIVSENRLDMYLKYKLDNLNENLLKKIFPYILKELEEGNILISLWESITIKKYLIDTSNQELFDILLWTIFQEYKNNITIYHRDNKEISPEEFTQIAINFIVDMQKIVNWRGESYGKSEDISDMYWEEDFLGNPGDDEEY